MGQSLTPPAGLHLGLSGWNYPAWRTSFYAGLPQRQWLAHCTRRFTGLEVNATFYRFIRPEVVAEWRDQAPPGFRFACKGHRFITHQQHLDNTGGLLSRLRDSLAPLGAGLATLLWQIPQTLPCDLPRLTRFCDLLRRWQGPRHVFEFRHPSWHRDEVADALDRLDCSICRTESAPWPAWGALTGPLAYVRCLQPHGDLDGLVHDVEDWRAEGREVHVYWEGDPAAEAPAQALALMRQVGAKPWEAEVPPPSPAPELRPPLTPL